jgi:hypothetical protein
MVLGIAYGEQWAIIRIELPPLDDRKLSFVSQG